MFSWVKRVLFVTLMLTGAVINAEELKFGMTTALTGPAQALGQGMQLGFDIYFQEVNAKGGINGNKISFIVKDDQYEPNNSAPNMRKLIDEEKVLAILGNVGTPTAIVNVPIANETKTLLYGSYTGAGILRKNPPDRYVVNFRASYAEETNNIIEALLDKGIKPEEIAFFTQNDGYGDAGFEGGMAALKKHGLTDVNKIGHGRYARNTVNVEDALGVLLELSTQPKAIIMVGTYAPCAKFIKLAKAEFPKAYFINVSFVGSSPLLEQLGADGEGVIVTQVVPHYDANLPVIKEYQAALQKFGKGQKVDFISLEGYIAAKLFVAGLTKVNGAVTKESLIDGLETLNNYDLGIGAPVTIDKANHQASHNIWPTIIKGGKYESFNWKDL